MRGKFVAIVWAVTLMLISVTSAVAVEVKETKTLQLGDTVATVGAGEATLVFIGCHPHPADRELELLFLREYRSAHASRYAVSVRLKVGDSFSFGISIPERDFDPARRRLHITLVERPSDCVGIFKIIRPSD